ncbi:glucose-6-phosphate dehydrogenase assembly protein OpcA [Vallicoccus soli]|uniref:Glucose-6-phosphate dehydrogenase assembly protein OpcA n=1 Tax=Vallicoccus soli TaxID=2339232 RepID=A0A3A3ZFB1_9ACTN|nr:glucose-6-phosphate dehydrogenase assembly protein OpcA [Vallicoccus soli]RJK93761.1 glucose-6-phosphate dehydrogenase assembly protein OpcA [Vallicoccus soli]
MIIDLVDTTAAGIGSAMLDARRRSGSPAMGMVLTLVIATDERDHYDAMRAATAAAREHPSRILIAIRRPGRDAVRLDAEVRVGGESGPGEVVLLRMYGPLADHADSVVLPLLLPDAPVVTWWAGEAPQVPAEDPLGALAQRRVTDAAGCADPLAELRRRADNHRPGDTDLAWTRTTSWRTQLASALDEPYEPVEGVLVCAEEGNPSAELLAAWLGDRLGVPVERRSSQGPGITEVSLRTSAGPITLSRSDGRQALLTRPGQVERTVALPRRGTADLVAEELRRLDPDDTYGATLAALRRSLAAAGS